MRKRASKARQRELSAEELAAQEAAPLPAREAMTLINPSLLNSDPSTLPASGPDAGQFAGQSAHDASALTSSSAADAAAAQDPSAVYQPSITNVARS